jgi:hypothetical protein
MLEGGENIECLPWNVTDHLSHIKYWSSEQSYLPSSRWGLHHCCGWSTYCITPLNSFCIILLTALWLGMHVNPQFWVHTKNDQFHQQRQFPNVLAYLQDSRPGQVPAVAIITLSTQSPARGPWSVQAFGILYYRSFLDLASQPYFPNECTKLLFHIPYVRC